MVKNLMDKIQAQKEMKSLKLQKFHQQGEA
jgi:hypothetical protein